MRFLPVQEWAAKVLCKISYSSESNTYDICHRLFVLGSSSQVDDMAIRHSDKLGCELGYNPYVMCRPDDTSWQTDTS